MVENDRFWTFRNNSVYRSTSNTQPEIAFQLPPGSEIQHLGTDSGFIWAIDDAHFHAFDIKSGKLSTYSLMELYRYSSSTSLSVNDALLLKDSWVLATRKGFSSLKNKAFAMLLVQKIMGSIIYITQRIVVS
ncbi:DNA-binding response regulator AraC family [Vibrio ponticus]|nr:DNA-binding response regulator AraC family [Vibrio ponticus]